jgi:hypothetical protein
LFRGQPHLCPRSFFFFEPPIDCLLARLCQLLSDIGSAIFGISMQLVDAAVARLLLQRHPSSERLF